MTASFREAARLERCSCCALARAHLLDECENLGRAVRRPLLTARHGRAAAPHSLGEHGLFRFSLLLPYTILPSSLGRGDLEEIVILIT